MKVLVLGDGLLGSEIIKQTGWDYVSRKKDNFDIINDFDGFWSIVESYSPEIIVNCIGYTNTYDPEREKHWEINYKFVVSLMLYSETNNIKLVHISTDYIYANTNTYNNEGARETNIPVHQQTWYSYCKLLADGYVQLSDNYLMFRCSFKPKPFPYEKAFGNVKGNFDYVDVIAKQMIELIIENRQGVWNIGTEFKSVYDLAIQTKPDMQYWCNDVLPTIRMNLDKYNSRNEHKNIG